jgi:ABC-type phosphate/phosphonate transport system substrate-binding protein
MATTFQLGYYPWITQHVDPPKIRNAVGLFASAVEQELQSEIPSAKVAVSDPIDVPRQIERIIGADNSIELMNPLGFVFGRQKSATLGAVAVAQRIIDGRVGVTYFSQLYTNVATGITDIQGATQKSVGYGVPFSTSNFLVPAYVLQRAGIHPFLDFTRIEFLGGHDKVAVAVYEQRVEIGAGHDGVIIDLSNQTGYSDAKLKLKTLIRSEPIPSDPVVVHVGDENVRRTVAAALVRASKSTNGRSALSIFWGNAQGLEATTSDAYDPIQSAIQALRLRAEDLFPKP